MALLSTLNTLDTQAVVPTLNRIITAVNATPNAGNISNLVAVTDPGVGNDSTQSYGPGSVWFNLTASRVWMNLSGAAGAAVWALDGVVPGVGIEPSSMLTQFGGGTATFLEEGNVNRQVSAAGVVPGSTANDNVLAVYTIPASSFDIAGRGLTLQTLGSFAANANNKTIKIIFGATTAVIGSAVTGGTAISTTGVSTGNGVGWQLTANVFKYGAAGSNTQFSISTGVVVGSTHGGMGVPILTTSPENALILIAVTGNAATTASDIVLNFLEVNAMN